MRVKVGRKSQTYAKVKKARTAISNLKTKLSEVRMKMSELDSMVKSCVSALSRIERNLNTITKDNLIATPKVTKIKKPIRSRSGKSTL